MSALSAISNYSSDSEESNADTTGASNHLNKKVKFPRPNLKDVAVVKSDEHVDDPEQHEGRQRSFPHVHGNWASFAYIKYPEDASVLKCIHKITCVLSDVGSFKRCDNFHISLSRTVVLKYHWIQPFVTSLQTQLQKLESFKIEFESVKVYCNEERTRTFIAREVRYHSHKYLLALTEKIDEALEAYNLPPFYEEPSYHMSILWIEGDKEKEVNKLVEKIIFILTSQSDAGCVSSVYVDKVFCNIGNKIYQFGLDL